MLASDRRTKSQSTGCPRLFSNAKMLKHNKSSSYDYWGAQDRYFRGDSVQKGFDFTQVDAKRWEEFKKKYGLTLVKKSPKGSKTHVFFSTKNCTVIVTNNEDKENYQNTYLSYVRFEAPKKKRGTLERMLRDFRGPTMLRDQDESLSCEGRRKLGPNCPAATYIKEEDAWAHPPLSYAAFV